MENIFVKNEYLNLSPNPLENVMANLQEAVKKNEALSIAMIAGCKIEVLFIQEEDGHKIIVKTIHKVSILKDNHGRVISVIEK